MATLSSALNYALAGLSVSSAQTAVVSRNVSSAGDETYSRKTAEIVTLPGTGPAISRVTRSSDSMLLERLLTSSSSSAERQALLGAMDRMSSLTGDPQDSQSISARLGALQDALRSYEQNPSSTVLGRAVLNAAYSIAQTLNSASTEVANIRTEADREISESVDRVSNLLSQFKVVNDSIVRGQGSAGDLTEALDQRDSILRLLAEDIGIRTMTRPNNDVVIYASGGAVLFEGSPRSINFQASGTLSAGSQGGALMVDGVPVTGAGATMTLSGGRISAYAVIRDTLAPQLSLQLDQVAVGLILSFSESDPQLLGTLPAMEGLFRGLGTLPLLAEANEGLAGIIRVNSMADPEQGGNVLLIRDGGFGGAAYSRNTDNLAGFQTRISELTDSLDSNLSFAPWGGLEGPASLKEFGAKSASWVESQRQQAKSALDAATALKSRAANTLLQKSGVSIDQEMATLLDLEKSYQASSKVLTVVNSMLDVLLEATR